LRIPYSTDMHLLHTVYKAKHFLAKMENLYLLELMYLGISWRIPIGNEQKWFRLDAKSTHYPLWIVLVTKMEEPKSTVKCEITDTTLYDLQVI